MKQVAIYGAGGFGREIAWIVEASAERDDVAVACFINDSSKPGDQLDGRPVYTFEEARRLFPSLSVVCAIGTPSTRKKVAEAVAAANVPFYTAIHPGAFYRKAGVQIGEGSMICAGVVMTTDIRIGKHVTVNLGCTIGHDCEIGDFVTITPGVNLTGRVHIHDGVYVGIGANIVCRSTTIPLVIGEGAVIAAGAVVLDDVAPGTMVAGVPAKVKVSRPR